VVPPGVPGFDARHTLLAPMARPISSVLRDDSTRARRSAAASRSQARCRQAHWSRTSDRGRWSDPQGQILGLRMMAACRAKYLAGSRDIARPSADTRRRIHGGGSRDRAGIETGALDGTLRAADEAQPARWSKIVGIEIVDRMLLRGGPMNMLT